MARGQLNAYIMRICTSQYVRWHQFQPPDTCALLFSQACLGSSSGYFENVCVDTAKSVLLGWGEGREFLSSTQSPRANRLASNHIRPPAPASAPRHQQCTGSPLAGGEYTSLARPASQLVLIQYSMFVCVSPFFSSPDITS